MPAGGPRTARKPSRVFETAHRLADAWEAGRRRHVVEQLGSLGGLDAVAVALSVAVYLSPHDAQRLADRFAEAIEEAPQARQEAR